MEETIYQVHLITPAIKQLHKSITFHLDQWPGGDPLEQENLMQLKDDFFRIVLEAQFQEDA